MLIPNFPSRDTSFMTFSAQTLTTVQSRFDEERINTQGVGGGVIPIAKDREGNWRILLGRERFINQWKGSCRWSGFEGSRKMDETLDEAVVREFVEESLGVVMSAQECRARLLKREYWIRVILNIHNSTYMDRYHSTYVMTVPWDEHIPDEFGKVRAHLEHTDRLIQEWTYIRPSVLGTNDEIGDVVETERTGEFRITRNTDTVPCIMPCPWEYVSDDNSIVQAVVKDEQHGTLKRWVLLRERIERAVERVSHEAIDVQRDAHWKHIQAAHLIKDYVEKDQTRWWTVDELWYVLQHRGQINGERFRPYFLPVLKTILEQLGTRPPSTEDETFHCKDCDEEEHDEDCEEDRHDEDGRDEDPRDVTAATPHAPCRSEHRESDP